MHHPRSSTVCLVRTHCMSRLRVIYDASSMTPGTRYDRFTDRERYARSTSYSGFRRKVEFLDTVKTSSILINTICFQVVHFCTAFPSLPSQLPQEYISIGAVVRILSFRPCLVGWKSPNYQLLRIYNEKIKISKIGSDRNDAWTTLVVFAKDITKIQKALITILRTDEAMATWAKRKKKCIESRTQKPGK